MDLKEGLDLKSTCCIQTNDPKTIHFKLFRYYLSFC